MLCGSTWDRRGALLQFGTTTACSSAQIQIVMDGNHVQCRLHCMLRAATPRCLTFNIFPSGWMKLDCVEIWSPPHWMKPLSHMLRGTALILQLDLLICVLQELQNPCEDHKRVPPFLPLDKQEVKTTICSSQMTGCRRLGTLGQS